MRRRWRDPSALVGGAAFGPIAVVVAHSFLDGFASYGLPVISPEIRDAFGLSLTAIAVIGVIGTAAIMVIGLPVAQHCDRVARKPVVALGVLAASICAVLAGLAPVLALYVVAISLFLVALSTNDSAQASLLADLTPVEARPTVYYGRQIVATVGSVVGPLVFGLLAALFGWRAPVLFLAVPALVLGIVTLRLREPARGGQERAAAGFTGAALDVDDESVPFAEAVRGFWAVPTLRIGVWSWLLFGGGLNALGVLAPLFLDEVVGVGPAGRGVIVALSGVVMLAAMLLGSRLARRLLSSERPQLMFTMIAAGGAVAGGIVVLFAAVPRLPLVIAGLAAVSFIYGSVYPAYDSIWALVMPARARTVGFALSRVIGLPTLLAIPICGAVGDAFGLRWGMVAAVPGLVSGAAVFALAGKHFCADKAAAIDASVETVRHLREPAASLTTTLPAASAGGANGSRSVEPLLSCRSVDVCYGPVQVLFGVDLQVDEGELVALLGTNGAGKSTLLRAISGTLPVSKGSIHFGGADITKAGPGKTTGIGLVQVPGGKGVFPSLTVAENLRAASWLHRADTRHVEAAMRRLLGRFPVLAQRWDTPAGNLSGGEQQMLTLAQALLAKPRILLIDELSLGLAPAIVAQLLDLVRALRDEGITVVLVEQSVNVALSLCDRAVFLEKGEVRFEGPTADLLHRPDVLHSVFLGGAAKSSTLTTCTKSSRAERAPVPSLAAPASRSAGRMHSALLEADGIGKRFGGLTAAHDVSLAVDPGEVLGLLGANGAGKTTVFDLLSGFLSPDEGRIWFRGADVTEWTPDRRARAGLGRSFQDARLFPSLTVSEVIAVAFERHMEVRDALSTVLYTPAAREAEKAIALRVNELIDVLGLAAFRDKFVSELSTGSRRVVDIACALAHEPMVLLLDEPSSGIAQRETEALAPVLLRIRDELGTSLLVIEHDMPLLREASDRLVCLEAGTPIVEGDPETVLNDPRVVASYLGSDQTTIDRSGAVATRKRRLRPLVAASTNGSHS